MTKTVNTLYDRKLLINLFIALGALWVLPIPAAPIYVGLAIYALLGPRQTIISIALLFLLLLGNKTILPSGSQALRWVVLFAGFAQVIFGSFKRNGSRGSNALTGWLLIFFLVMFPISWVSSQMPTISVLKLVSFYVGVTAIVVSFLRTRHYAAYWQRWFTTFFFLIIGASILVFFSGGGYERNGVGFQGIFGHPQLLGPVMATIAAWLWGQFLFEGARSREMLIAAFFALVMIYASQARTAALALVAGFVLTYILLILKGRVNALKLDRRAKNLLYLFTPVLLILIVAQTDQVRSLVTSFAQKRTENAEVSDLIQESRGALINQSLENYRSYPFTGIGLGVPSDYRYNDMRNVETVMGIPVGASVEKGFLPSAILEEMGLLGAFFTVFIILSAIAIVSRRASFPIVWLLFGVIFINIGEAVFYSIGGLGLYVWLMIGFCVGQTSKKTYQ